MTISSTGVPVEPRLLDALAVEAALVGRRPLDQLAPAEAAEVLRILRRRTRSLYEVTVLLDVAPQAIAGPFTPSDGAQR